MLDLHWPNGSAEEQMRNEMEAVEETRTIVIGVSVHCLARYV